MLSEEDEETQFMFWRYVVFGGILLILSLCGVGRDWFGDPTVGIALLLTWILYSIWSWKNKKELFKRFVLALPFALLIVVLLGLTVFELSDSWVFGMLMFFVLTAGKENLKQFFVIRLVIGAILISLLAILVTLINSILAGPVR